MNQKLVNYHGELLNLKQISDKEKIPYAILIKEYRKLDDIYEAVKEARRSKKGKVEYSKPRGHIEKIEYKGERVTLHAISEMEEISKESLKREYLKSGNIYEAVKICKANSRGELKRIPYKGQKLTIHAIAKMEGIDSSVLGRYYLKIGEISQAVERVKGKYIEYYGEKLTLNSIAKKEGLSRNTLSRVYSKIKDIYRAVNICKTTPNISGLKTEIIEYHGEKLTLEEIAQKEALDLRELNRYYKSTGNIYNAIVQYRRDLKRKVKKLEYENGEILAISVIAKRENISLKDLNRVYNETKDIFEAVKRCKEIQKQRKERKEQIEQNEKEEYYGQRIRLREIAAIEGIDANKLREYFRDTKDVYKAVFMAKHQKQKEKVVTYPGISIDLYDLSLLIGVNYTYLINLLNEGISIAEIKENYANSQIAGENIRLKSGRTLLEFCTSEKLKFDFMYRAICTYGKNIKDATDACKNDSKSIPATWVCEKYHEKLNQLGIVGAQEAVILNDLQHKKTSLDEAVELCIIRKNARKNSISVGWGETLYGLVQMRKLLGQEFHSEIKINESEIEFLEECDAELLDSAPTCNQKTQEDITHD